jgi:DNA-binding CsgD family transcriptional regulator
MSIEQHDGDEVSVADPDVIRLSELIRSAVEITKPHFGDGTSNVRHAVSEHVVFDLDVDGNRYILIKTVSVERRIHSLSPREREIVRMVALGHQNKVIAAVLNISSWTVCTHVRRIFTKLGVTSRAAMVARAADFDVAITPYCDGDSREMPRGIRSRMQPMVSVRTVLALPAGTRLRGARAEVAKSSSCAKINSPNPKVAQRKDAPTVR